MDRGTPSRSIAQPGLEVVVGWMRKFAIKGSNDLAVLKKVKEVCASVQPGDYASEVLAAYYWVCANVRYMRDPYDTEMVMEPGQLLETKSGDCDDIATLLAAMMLAMGNRCAFRLASFASPPSPSHVYVVVFTPAGPIPLDPVANRETAKMSRRLTWSRDVPIQSDVAQEDRWSSF